MLGAVLVAAWHTYRQKYLAYWAAYWAVYAVGWPTYALFVYSVGTHRSWAPIAGFCSTVLSYLARILFILGTVVYMGWRKPRRAELWGLAAGVVVLAVLGEIVRESVARGAAPLWAMVPLRSFFLGGIVMLAVGVLILRRATDLPRRVLGIAVLCFGLSDGWDSFADAWMGPAWADGPTGLRLSVFISQLTDALSGAGMLVAAIGTERERAESALDELRKREDQLGHMRKIEAAGQLAGGLAHDFNNLLTVIVASLAFVRARLPRGDQGHQDVDAAAAAADRAARLTRQLLTFARRQPVEPRVTNLTDTIDSLDRMLAALLSERVTRRAALAGNLWNVLVDPAQVEQVIVNLVVNARDAMPTGGVLTLETRNVRREDGEFVLLAVEDTGIGMDAATQERIFEPFFTTKLEGKGTGLGLATVYGIVRQAGGQIEVRSSPGKGARFEVLLRRCEAGPDPRSLPPPASPRGTEQILLVENEAGVRAAAARALVHQGYSVLEAEGGQAALELPLEKVALAIVDVVMPGMDGWELGRELRRRRPDQRLLFISGFVPSPADALERSSFLPKPFTPDQLVRRVREVLDAV